MWATHVVEHKANFQEGVPMRVHRMVQNMLFVGIILVAVQAYAAPVHLACNAIDNKGSKTSVTIDESAHQAFIGTSDPVIADFTETSVKWSTTVGDESSGVGKSDFVLDRVTGELRISTRIEQSNYFHFAVFSCEIAEKKF
jgi:hypothetical protein